jgi:serine-type D-Ala-D-Ala carboxypeptidase/endopeptidase (penicillin-binding protein 4)
MLRCLWSRFSPALIALLVGISTPQVATANRSEFRPGRSPSGRQLSQAQPNLCPNQLASELEAIINRSEFRRARWGVLVQTLGGSTLYERDADKYFTPASNAKLLTTAAALRVLGPDFRLQTNFYGIGNGANLQKLWVVGRGDPSLSEAQLQTVARQLYQQGVRQIEELVGDDQYFQGELAHPTWEWEDVQAGYGAPVNSLIVNQNAIALTLIPQQVGQTLKITFSEPEAAGHWQIENLTRTVSTSEPEFVKVRRDPSASRAQVVAQLRTGAEPDTVELAVNNPTDNFLRRFRKLLQTEQIQVGRVVAREQSPSPGSRPLSVTLTPGQLLAEIKSPPLRDLIVETNRFSNNLYAEALLRTLGSTQPNPERDTASTGLQILQASLTQLKVDPESYQLQDGSGLSRRNLISPAALVQLLQSMAQAPEASVFRNSLTVAGINGTLKSRLLGTPAQGQLQGKTGTLTDAVSLSGYLSVPGAPQIVFSLMVNQSGQSTTTLRTAIDQLVVVLTRLRQC